MDLIRIDRPVGFPAGGRPRRQANLADKPYRPSSPSWRIASPSEKQSDSMFAGNALADQFIHLGRSLDFWVAESLHEVAGYGTGSNGVVAP